MENTICVMICVMELKDNQLKTCKKKQKVSWANSNQNTFYLKSVRYPELKEMYLYLITLSNGKKFLISFSWSKYPHNTHATLLKSSWGAGGLIWICQLSVTGGMGFEELRNCIRWGKGRGRRTPSWNSEKNWTWNFSLTKAIIFIQIYDKS